MYNKTSCLVKYINSFYELLFMIYLFYISFLLFYLAFNQYCIFEHIFDVRAMTRKKIK